MDHSNSSNNNSLPTMSTQEIDNWLRESIEAKSGFEDWKMQYAADCYARGVSCPKGVPLQREWNAEQKRRSMISRAAKKRAEHMTKLAKLKAQLGIEEQVIQQEEEQAISDELDAITASLMKMQENKDLADRAAIRQQQELAQLADPEEVYSLQPEQSGEDKKQHSKEQYDGDDYIENI